jgi:hypothetical protein
MQRFWLSLGVGFSCLLLAAGMEAQQSAPAASPGAAQSLSVPVPRLIRFSGTVREVSGEAARGVVDVTFALYREDWGGEPLWYETQTVEVDAQGRYNVLLGAMHPDGLPMDLFTSGEARWLGIMAGKVEQPRVLLVSVPYALKAADAESLGGRPATAYVASDQLKDQVQSELQGQLADPKVGLRSLEMMVTSPTVTASSGGSEPPALINETEPATFTCNISQNCVTVTQSGTGNVLFAQSSAATAVVTGVRGETASTSGVGVYGFATAGSGATYGVRGQTASTGGYAVYGVATAVTGQTYGLRGDSASTSGRGIFGYATATSGTTYGILGTSASTGGIGLMGQAVAVTGNTIGLRAETRSPTSTGAVIDNLGGGKLISARTTGFVEKFSVDGSGNVTATSFIGSGASLTGVGDITAVTTAAGSGLQGGVTTGAAALSLLTSCGASQVLKFVGSAWQCADDNTTVVPAATLRGINYLAGCDSCTALADTDDQQDFYVNVIGPLTILSIACYTDGGSPSINIQRDDGTPANILAPNLTCTTGGASGTIDPDEATLSVGQKLDFQLITSGGAKRITVAIKAAL